MSQPSSPRFWPFLLTAFILEYSFLLLFELHPRTATSPPPDIPLSVLSSLVVLTPTDIKQPTPLVLKPKILKSKSFSQLSHSPSSSFSQKKIEPSSDPHSPSEQTDFAPSDERPSSENQASLPDSHGPLLLESPHPVLPEHLHHQEIQAEVVIEFQISAQGKTTPLLIRSSQFDELDRLALQAAKKWTFQPARKDQKSIDSKIRLRISFEVR